MPSPAGLARVWLGLTPEMIGILAPVALLFATVTVARSWSEGGEMRALSCAGVSSHRLIHIGLLTGVAVGIGVAVCTHLLGPSGRLDARYALTAAVAEAPLRANTPAQMGDVWIRVDRADSSGAEDVVVATGDWLTWARRGRLSGEGLLLEDGQARSVNGDWTLSYRTAKLPIVVPLRGAHNFERSSHSLWAQILSKEERGERATRARLTLHKRTTLALSAPLFGLLGIPLGLAFRKPAWATAGVVLTVWALQRLGDHLAPALGAESMALAPLLLLSIAIVFARRRMRRPL